jgi:hypothetical protein
MTRVCTSGNKTPVIDLAISAADNLKRSLLTLAGA